jgi:ketosteroid isomerase-like protein
MSQQNVEIIRRWNAAYNTRDHNSLRELTHPEFEFQTIFLTVESVFRGHEGLDAYFKAIDGSYERFVVPGDEFIDAGAAVLVVGRAEWRGRESGAEGTMPLFVAAWLRAGKVFRIETFTDRSEALEAVGLSEQDAHQRCGGRGRGGAASS